MRKFAFIAAVLPSAAAASAAIAAEPITASVSGYANFGAGYADKAGQDPGFGIFRDGEIHFNVEGASDNGITFYGQVELEAFSTSDQIDENCFGVRGGFGDLAFGGCDTALNEVGGLGVVYPTAKYINYYDGDVNQGLPGYPGGFIGENDSVGVHYFAPLIAGFALGFSYQPDATTDGLPGVDDAGDANDLVVPPGGDSDNQFAVGANWTGAYSGFALGVGGGYLRNETLDQWHVGAEVGYAGFQLAGFYNTSDADDAIGGEDQDTWGVGALYETGPWRIGGGYARQETDGPTPGDSLNSDFLHIGGGYDLMPGVSAFGAVQYGDEDPGPQGAGIFAWLNLRF